MQLLAREIGIADAGKGILFNAHDGGYVLLQGHDELVNVYDGFEGEQLQAIHCTGGRASGIETEQAEVLVRQANSYGDGLGMAYDVADGFGTAEHTHVARNLIDGDGQ